MKLLEVDSVERAREKLIQYFETVSLKAEDIPLQDLGGRILAKDIFVSQPIPNFARSTVDGYAVVSKDTAAASENMPVLLKLIGEVVMGKAADCPIQSGECAYIPTGGMLPQGAESAVMVEYCETFGDDSIMVYQAVAYGENIINIGEDAQADRLLVKKGAVLGPAQIAALAAAGFESATVYKRLNLAIISTGDELITPGTPLLLGQVYDMNSYGLKALAEKNGFCVTSIAVLKDDETAILQYVQSVMAQNDVVIISGGSSQGKKDATAVVIDALSNPGVFTHGVAIKPGKPTIIGFDTPSQTLLMGLPGHPVSAIIVFEMILNRAIKQRRGTVLAPPISARLAINMAGAAGRLSCIPVTLKWEDEGYIATPVFGKSGLITTLSQAEGFFEIERNREGLASGQQVLVHLF